MNILKQWIFTTLIILLVLVPLSRVTSQTDEAGLLDLLTPTPEVTSDETPDIAPVLFPTSADVIPEATPIVVPADPVPAPADTGEVVSNTVLYVILVFVAVLLVSAGILFDRLIRQIAPLVPPSALPTFFTAANLAYSSRQELLDRLQVEADKTVDEWDNRLIEAARTASDEQWRSFIEYAKQNGITLPERPISSLADKQIPFKP